MFVSEEKGLKWTLIVLVWFSPSLSLSLASHGTERKSFPFEMHIVYYHFISLSLDGAHILLLFCCQRLLSSHPIFSARGQVFRNVNRHYDRRNWYCLFKREEREQSASTRETVQLEKRFTQQPMSIFSFFALTLREKGEGASFFLFMRFHLLFIHAKHFFHFTCR